MKRMITLLATAGCLLFATSCNKDNDKKQFATNKAGERLVEKVEATQYNTADTTYFSYHFSYNSDGTLKTLTHYWNSEDSKYHYVLSFEKKNNTLYMNRTDYDATNTIDDETSTSFDLNSKGLIVLDRGWEGKENFRLSYDESGKYLHSVFDGDELMWTFEWEDGNIFNDEVAYTTQSHPSNMDWCAFFQSWRHLDYYRHHDDNEDLVDLPSICLSWGFSEGYLGSKCQGLPSEDYECNYTYDFDEDGFVSAIYRSYKSTGKITYKVTYKSK
ncbi:MAG: hypothetical protein NC048_02445 [Bacteroides sp.]|nr:hypothetical protein [Ruminococcus flavefaciens]MCM1554337.1 hypothetical protein [Bacteroides sp.]